MVMYRQENGVRIQLTAQEEKAVMIRVNDEEEEKIELAKTQYQRDRKAEYPPIVDYLDGIVKGDQAQVDKYIADCLAVKEKYPKGDN